MKNHQYSLEEIEEIIFNELSNTHCNYKYMVDVIFPLLNQNAIRKVYPAILIRMQTTAQQAIIIGLSKLLDTSRDQKIIHLKKFINSARKVPLNMILRKDQWDDFLEKSEEFLKEIPSLKHNLDPLRNRFYAHLMPIIPDPPEKTTWEFWRKILERMENIFNLYQGAVKDKNTSQFWTTNLDYEPQNFLKWCRLDDFKQHREEELKKRKIRNKSNL